MNNDCTYIHKIYNKISTLPHDSLVIKNVSHNHKGHSHFTPDKPSHIQITIISSAFQNISIIQRHKMIFNLLQDEMNNWLHSVSIQALTPTENTNLTLI